MNDLERYFYKNKDRAIHKFAHYFEIYERHFERFRLSGKPVKIVEIGVADGGSLQMWKHYFGPQAKVYGVDRSLDTKVEEDQIKLIHGDQGDLKFMQNLPFLIDSEDGEIDIVIDDGSHMSLDQRVTLACLYPYLSENGIYVCEDVQTSYQEQFDGGYKKPGTFIEVMKDMIDQLNGWCAEPEFEFLKTHFTRSTFAIHFYTYMIVIEKRRMDSVMRSPVVSGGVHVQP